MTKKIKDVMTHSPHTIGDEQTLNVAKQEMAKHGIRHLPVLNGGRCIGLISDRDIKLAYAVEFSKADDVKVRDACAGEVYAIKEDEPLKNVAAFMAKNLIGSAVIVNSQDKVLGIFTVTDACKILAELL